MVMYADFPLWMLSFSLVTTKKKKTEKKTRDLYVADVRREEGRAEPYPSSSFLFLADSSLSKKPSRGLSLKNEKRLIRKTFSQNSTPFFCFPCLLMQVRRKTDKKAEFKVLRNFFLVGRRNGFLSKKAGRPYQKWREKKRQRKGT